MFAIENICLQYRTDMYESLHKDVQPCTQLEDKCTPKVDNQILGLAIGLGLGGLVDVYA